ncbi:MAG: FHA domain-containing protein [Planctomycetia bacterium]|nr:FHA domain-containing protein [Planctomycetia bacterium]MCC7314257.1 FHA domain-containing protein [Planctomycetota bacterium]
MALVVCCPCGNPLDCDQLDLVVTVNCPLCKKELTLELEDSAGRSSRAVLTVMEGPFWVGEQFIMPVGHELRIGKAIGNWLALDAEGLSQIHCRLNLGENGTVILEDAKSESGTWINKQRIERGKLGTKQSFRAGEFRFRLDIQSSDGTTVVAAPGAAMPLDESAFLPVMREVKDRRNPLRWFSINRFMIARSFMTAFAILMGLFHLFEIHRTSDSSRPWLVGIAYGVGIAGIFLLSGRRVALAHKHLKYGSLAVLVLFAILDLAWSMPVPAIAGFAMAACVTVLILRIPGGALALIGTTVGVCSVTILVTGLAMTAGSSFSTP